jgi:hypothetical protein
MSFRGERLHKSIQFKTNKEVKNGERIALPAFLSQGFDGFLGVICR